MAKVEIITRAFNRLEYTVMCIRGINLLAGMDDYRHIIINQASTDGTGQWLASLSQEPYYTRLHVVNNVLNSGDAGGMNDGLKRLSDDCRYVMQFDNDCEPLTRNFLFMLTYLLDRNHQIGALMLKRKGVNRILEPELTMNLGGIVLGKLPENKNYTCCTILRRELVEKFHPEFSGDQIGWVQYITRRIRRTGGEVYKTMNICVNHIDGSVLQSRKYRNYYKNKTTKGSNFTVVNYV